MNNAKVTQKIGRNPSLQKARSKMDFLCATLDREELLHALAHLVTNMMVVRKRRLKRFYRRQPQH